MKIDIEDYILEQHMDDYYSKICPACKCRNRFIDEGDFLICECGEIVEK